MYSDQEVERQRVVVDTPGERRETVVETTYDKPKEVKLSPGVLAVIALVVLAAVGLTIYVVSNKNANEEANRQAMIDANRAQQTAPAPAQQPVIIQQPAPQAPVVVQPPPVAPVAPAAVATEKSALDDVTIQDAATKRLTDDPALATVSVLVIDGRARLSGSVDSTEHRAQAEQVVRAVRGVKSVENRIEVTRQ